MSKKVLPLIFIIIAFMVSCKSSKNLNPITLSENQSSIPIFSEWDIKHPNHDNLGMWIVNFDLNTLGTTVIPYRDIQTHFNVTPFLQPPSINVNSYNPITRIIDVNVTLTNSTGINGYDVRLIIFTNNQGVRLLNPDDWTSLYDISGGLPINPFKAYAKEENKRKFTQSSFSENLLVYLPPNNPNVNFAVDASFPGNCFEPYEISGFNHGKLISSIGSTANAWVYVKDWQNNTNSVTLYCPGITGSTLTQFEYSDANLWRALLSNKTGASMGEYIGYLLAGSSDDGTLLLFDEVVIKVDNDAGWTRSFGGANGMDGDDIIIDYQGNIYCNGFFEGTVDFNPGSGTDYHTAHGIKDCFVLKLDPNGNYIWARSWGGSGECYANGINVDSFGNIYVCGRFQSQVDFDPGTGIDIHTSKGDYDAFISKFDTNGQFIWARTWGSNIYNPSRYEFCGDVNFDKAGNIFGTGHFMGIVDFDPGPGGYTKSSRGDTDVYLTKFDPDGNHILTLTWGGTLEDQSIELHTDKTGNVFISGFFKGSVDFDPGSSVDTHTSNGDFDIFISKFDPYGTYLWAVTWGGSDTDEDRVIFTDDDGNICTAGFFKGSVDFDPGPGVVIRTAVAQSDIFLLKLDCNGNFIWVRNWGGSGNEHVYGATIDTFGNIVVSGFFYGSCDFDPGENLDLRTSIGAQDIFISKYNGEGLYMWTRTYGSTGEDVGGGVITDPSCVIYGTGRFSYSIDFNPGIEIDMHTSLGSTDSYVTKLMPSGYY